MSTCRISKHIRSSFGPRLSQMVDPVRAGLFAACRLVLADRPGTPAQRHAGAHLWYTRPETALPANHRARSVDQRGRSSEARLAPQAPWDFRAADVDLDLRLPARICRAAAQRNEMLLILREKASACS